MFVMIHTGVPGGTRLSVISPGEPGNSGGAAVYGRRSILYVYVLSPVYSMHHYHY